MVVLINEQVKASEVLLTGLRGEKLGTVSRAEALSIAKAEGADLVCVSLMSSPPPCSLTAKGKGKAVAQKKATVQKAGTGRSAGKSNSKVKELRFTAYIEEHDYNTKLRQADKHLRSGKPVQLVVKASGTKAGMAAKSVLERLVIDLKGVGAKDSGIQTSGKGSQVKLNPNSH